jgi:ABC-2 type transport system ATP-binding protein
MEMPALAIEAENLKKSYRNVEVLRDVSFGVKQGTIFALLGVNGSGKTTTINILTTLLSADGGTATVGGFDVAAQPKSVRGQISLTGQFAAVDEVLTGRENLLLIGELRHVKDPAQTAQALLEQFGLAEAADRRAGTYSAGMRRRLDIAMSLIGNPPVLFLDEPTTGLDPQSRNMMWALITTLAKGGTTIFLTTQYLDEADQLADTIAILSQGRIVAQGTAQDLKKTVPQGRIELVFHDQEHLDAAARLLEREDAVRDDGALSLIVTTDGSVGKVAQLFNLLQAARIEVAEFFQKTTTLDEVFLKIIGGSTEEA